MKLQSSIVYSLLSTRNSCCRYLGLLGTVWGVTEAVDGLRQGISKLFESQELTEGVRNLFDQGFGGLVFAF